MRRRATIPAAFLSKNNREPTGHLTLNARSPLRQWLALSLLVVLTVSAPVATADDFDSYLLMKPIQNAFNAGDFTLFRKNATDRISVNFEPPFDLHGYFYIDKFIDDFTGKLAQLETQKMVWVSKQLEEQFAVQSLNLILKSKRSDKTVYYKLIFFLTKKNQEWKIYYLRGLKI